MSSETILTNPTPAELAAAVEENLFAFFRAMTVALPGGELDETGGVGRHHTFPSNPMFKGVWQSRLTAETANQTIDNTIDWFKERQAPFLFWWTGSQTTPANLAEKLLARGMISMEHGSGAPGMTADLNQLNEAALSQVPSGFTVGEVLDEQALSDFKSVLIKSYNAPEPLVQGWIDATLQAGLGRSPWKFYLGRLDGVPVATNILYHGAGVVGVYGIGTVPEVRRQGIGGAITLQPLLASRANGYRYAVLFSSEIGVHAYERIGFRDTGLKINRYLWRNG